MAIAQKKHAEAPLPNRTHYSFKNWRWDNDGNRHGAFDVDPKGNRSSPDLISTAVTNRTGSKTVLTLDIDVDAKRTDAKWIDTGVVSWNKVSELLRGEYPLIFDAIDVVVRSTSGSGFHLLIGIKALELGGNWNQIYFIRLAESVQKRLVKLLNVHGIGADPSALGLVRDYPNHFDTRRLIVGDNAALNNSRRVDTPDNVVRLNSYLEEIGYPFKEPVERFYPDSRVEQGLAKLYLVVSEAFVDGDSVSMALKEILELTGCSDRFMRKFLKTPPEWLSAEWCGRVDGWQLTLMDSMKKLSLAREVVAKGPRRRSSQSIKAYDLCPPELVADGERNDWLTKLALCLKHKGLSEHHALNTIGELVPRIPGHETSRNCRGYSSIVRSIYRHREEYEGCRSWMELPEWLSNQEAEEVGISCLEGDVVPGPAALLPFSVAVEDELPQGFLQDDKEENQINYIKQGGQGDLPPLQVRDSQIEQTVLVEDQEESSTSDDASVESVLIDFIAGFAPKAAKSLLRGKSGDTEAEKKEDGGQPSLSDDVRCDLMPSPVALEPPIGPQIFEDDLVNSSPPLKLSEARKADFDFVDPMDRFYAAYLRCLTRKTDQEMFKILLLAHRKKVRGKIKRSDCLKKGDPFRRLVRSFLMIHEELRFKILRDLQEECRG